MNRQNIETCVEDAAVKMSSSLAYFGLKSTGYALNAVVSLGNSIGNYVDKPPTIATLTIIDLNPYLKPIADLPPSYDQSHVDSFDASLETQDEKHVARKPEKLYEVRNQLLHLVAMGLHAMPITSRFFDMFTTPSSRSKVAEKNEALRSFHIYSSGALSERLSFSFAGSSWLMFYELGCARALKEFVNVKCLEECSFLGSSTSSIIATALALSLPLEVLQEELIDAICKMSQTFLGPVSSMSKLWTTLLEKIIPADISLLGADRLFLSLSKFPTMKNEILSTFTSKQDLISHILASCYIPVLFESPVKIKNELYMNGSWSREGTIPVLENRITITISPYAGHANICPRLARYTNIQETFPPSQRNACESMINDGWSDTKDWLLLMDSTKTLPKLFFTPSLTPKNLLF